MQKANEQQVDSQRMETTMAVRAEGRARRATLSPAHSQKRHARTLRKTVPVHTSGHAQGAALSQI
jgi:hypothetical protein